MINNISVCMATYNGEKYIREQIDSILTQLKPEDELIIVDDASKDSTVEIVNNYKDCRIILYHNEANIGVNQSFSKAISYAKNNYIFMADQDDIWCDNRIDIMINALKESNAMVVSGNSRFIDQRGSEVNYEYLPLSKNASNDMFKNIVKIFKGTASYYGCTMAFDRRICKVILPIPGYVESHDLWIALAGILIKRNVHVDDIVLMRRIHGNNASIVKRSLGKKIWSRIIFLLSIINLLYRNSRLGVDHH